jgi:hypothetical protein
MQTKKDLEITTISICRATRKRLDKLRGTNRISFDKFLNALLDVLEQENGEEE